MVWAVREVLRLQREGRILDIGTADAADRAVEPIGGVDLEASLSVKQVQCAPARWVEGMHRELRPRRVAFLVQQPVVVVAVGDGELLVAVVDARADRGGGAEVERRARHGRELAQRKLTAIERQVSPL